MKKTTLALLSFLCFSKGIAQEIKSPAQIQAELDLAQRDFEIAKSMFIPWYTGPLITGSASNVPMGKYNIQGYLFLDNQYAKFLDNRKSQDIPNIYTINPLLVLQRGLTHWLDITLTPQGIFRWNQGEYAQAFGDLPVTFGFQVVKQTPHIPSVRLTLGESFPTGKYQKLDPAKGGIDASGSGAYATIVGLNLNKILWWLKLHPISLRFSGTYEIPNHDVSVKNFNAYGGGFGTDGKVSVGQTLNLDFGVEVSITQKWVFATDVAYTYSRSTSFSGIAGIDATGASAANGGPSSDQLSLAPAIEYNVSDTGGFIGGVWFAVTGRNSSKFIDIILSYTQLF